jgi:hypothetical protein
MIKWQATQGITRVETVTLRDSSGAAYTGFTGAESLTCTVWPGDDITATATLPASWLAAANGTITVQIPGATTATLAEGIYQWLLALTDSTAELARGTLAIELAPGTATQTVQPYCTLHDMLLHAPWVELVQSGSDQAGFYEQRLEARRQMDWAILNNYRGASVGLFEQHSVQAFAFGGGVGWRRSQGPSPSLVTYLAQNKLILRPQIVRVCAYWAISEVSRAQIGINNAWAAQGPYYEALAERELCGTTAEVDLNGDGVGELFINLGSTNPLMT